MSQFFQELKRRKVLTTLGVYGAAAFIIIQVADIVFTRLLFPDWTVTFVIVLLILGFPITFFLSWTYDLKRENKTDDASEHEDVNKYKKWSLTKKILFPVTGFILMLIGGIFWFISPFLTIGMGHEKEYDASIAILYMENISPEEKSYFADGLTEELINRLSRIQNIRVRPKTDVAAFKDKKPTISEIVDKLKVNYIVEGSVRISGDELRTNVQLFDIGQDKITWSETYDKKLKNIFDLQDEIASSIVKKLAEKLTITKLDLMATKRKSTENLEAYKLINECYDILSTPKEDSKVLVAKAMPLVEKAILLDSTYAEAYAALALIHFWRNENHDASDEAMKDANDAIIWAEKALFYDPDNELALAETIVIPAFQMRAKKWAKEDIGDLFKLRQATVKMDHGLKKFPDSPFFLSIGGMYFSIKYQITQNKANLNQALPYLLKSHSILKNTFGQNNDFLLESANDINFEMIPYIYLWIEKEEKASEFIIMNRNMACEDGTYDCLGFWKLSEFSQILYNTYNYDEALEFIDLIINDSDYDIEQEGISTDKLILIYRTSGMIHMKRGDIKLAIDDFNNALSSIPKSDDDWNWSLQTINTQLGFAYYYNKDFKNAASYFLRAQSFYNPPDDEEKTQKIGIQCNYGLSELLTGNLDTSEKAIHTAESWLKEHPLNKEDNDDYDAYYLYWPLYLYYDKLNQSDKANKYLEMAYEIIEKEKIDKYNKHPEKDTYPEFFYCRDIIKAYESSLNQ